MARTKDIDNITISVKIPKEKFETFSALLLLLHLDSNTLVGDYIEEFIEKHKDIINFDKLPKKK